MAFSAIWWLGRPGFWGNHLADGAAVCTAGSALRLAVEGMHVKHWDLVLHSGTLAAALPGGVRDAGVRAVDRAEAGVRRWALFVGGAAFLFRVLLWH
jgi:hypothetical protein